MTVWIEGESKEEEERAEEEIEKEEEEEEEGEEEKEKEKEKENERRKKKEEEELQLSPFLGQTRLKWGLKAGRGNFENFIPQNIRSFLHTSLGVNIQGKLLW